MASSRSVKSGATHQESVAGNPFVVAHAALLVAVTALGLRFSPPSLATLGLVCVGVVGVVAVMAVRRLRR